MQKGQVSFDLILAIIVALIFIGSIQVVNQEMDVLQKYSAVKNQEKLMALQIYGVVSTAKTLSDADNLTINFKTKKLLVPGAQVLEECLIDFVTNTISYTLDETDVSVDIPDYGDTSGLILPTPQITCGEVITITNS
ncbi:MAG: hypothetical protein QGI60_04905 [archaeon]|nr:hypothetical protein [archaeon]